MFKEIKTEQFSGPLDLLLKLIEEKKVPISKIVLSEITEQYLIHIRQIEEEEPEELADFLVIATRLLLIKSSLLLPQFSLEEEEEENLEDQLKLYKAFVDASKKVNKMWLSNDRGFFRFEPPKRHEEFVAPQNVNISSLHIAFLKIIKQLTPPKPLPITRIDKTISLKERIEVLHKLLKEKKELNFYSVVGDSNNRTEVIVFFLAILELVKQKTIVLKQNENFADIQIIIANN